jgi:hypothetical protein
MKWLLLSGLGILVAWTALDVLLHRILLATIYQENASLWRPLDQLNVILIYVVTFTLIGAFIATYRLLVRPKSLGAGVRLGAFIGLALGISAGFGTYIHMPVPLALAWGWLIGGCLKGIAAGAIVGALVPESREAAREL